METVEEAVQVKDEVTQAQELLQAKENEIIQTFMSDYKELCQKHGLQLSPVVTLSAKGIIPDLEVVKL